jgi:rod shape-determining protein MreD
VNTSKPHSSYGFGAAVPFLIAMLAAALTTLPYGLTFGLPAGPQLTLIVVFFWIARRPELLPPIALFFIGIWHDALSGAPMGLTPLLLLVVRAAIVEQNVIVFSQSFVLGWIGFAAISTLATGLEWAVVSWMQGSVYAGWPSILQVLLSIAFYVPVALVCSLLDRWTIGGRRS